MNHPLIVDYLARLDRAAAALPPDRRGELLEGITEHISSAGAADEAEVRTLLDRLGEPAEIVAAAREDLPGATWGPPALIPVPRGTGHELAAVLMLTVGSLLPVVGWLVGVVLLWTSSLWRTREKVFGTLVVPLGPGGFLFAAAFLPGAGGVQYCESSTGASAIVGEPGAPPVPDSFLEDETVSCSMSGTSLSGGTTLALGVVLVVLPVLMAVVLLRLARRRAAEHPVLVPQYGPPPASPWGGLEVTGLLLLGLGGLVIPLVPALVGLVLVLISSAWTGREKLVGALLAGLPVLVAGGSLAASSLSDGALALGPGEMGLLGGYLGLLVGPIVAAGWFFVRLQRCR